LRAAASVGKCPRALTARRIRALIDSIALVVQMIVRIREPLTQVPTHHYHDQLTSSGMQQAGPRGQHPAVARTHPPTWPPVIGTRDSASRGLSCVTVVVWRLRGFDVIGMDLCAV